MKLTTKNSDARTFRDILKKQRHHSHDVVVPSSKLRMTDEGLFKIQDAPLPDSLASTLRKAGVSLSEENRATLPYRGLNQAHKQLVSKLPIPAFKRAYDFMLEDNPEQLSEVVNHYLSEAGKNYLVRTFRPDNEDGSRGIMRAVLSERYEVINNFDVYMRALKTIREAGISPKVKCHLSNTTMYVAFTMPQLAVNAKEFVGNYRNPHPGSDSDEIPSKKVYPGFILKNSEVGAAAFSIAPRLIIQVCGNGMIRTKDALRKIHLGSKMDKGVVDFSDDVRKKALELTDLQVKEAVETFVSKEYLYEAIEDVMGSGANEELEHPKEALSNSADELDMTQEEEDELFDFFTRGGSTKRSAIPQAVTAMSQHIEDIDRSFELEENAWGLLDNMKQIDVQSEQMN